MFKFKNILLAILLIGITVVGCKKEENTPQEKSYINKINELTTEYKKNNSSSVAKKPTPLWKRILKIAGKDIVGGLAGAYTGAKIGAVVGAAGGPASAAATASTGAVVGGLAGGIGASLVEAGGIHYTGSPGSIMGNTGNSYDIIGSLHIVGLADARTNPDTYFNPNLIIESVYSNSVKALLSNGLISSINNLPYSTSDLAQTISETEQYDYSDLELILTNMYNNDNISEDVYNSLSNYFSIVQTFTDYDTFFSYSTQFEDIVIESTMSNIDKEIILITAATSRYDIAYWLRSI